VRSDACRLACSGKLRPRSRNRDKSQAGRKIFVETFEPSHPFGVKAVAEIPMDGVAPAVGNAIFDATGINIDENPTTPERVWKLLKANI
jgi:hypothetical protein